MSMPNEELHGNDEFLKFYLAHSKFLVTNTEEESFVFT